MDEANSGRRNSSDEIIRESIVIERRNITCKEEIIRKFND